MMTSRAERPKGIDVDHSQKYGEMELLAAPTDVTWSISVFE